MPEPDDSAPVGRQQLLDLIKETDICLPQVLASLPQVLSLLPLEDRAAVVANFLEVVLSTDSGGRLS